jgi:transglutaminase-like putative cysteine protease
MGKKGTVRVWRAVFALVAVLALAACSLGDATGASRRFKFTYGATVSGLSPGEPARIWLPLAAENGQQSAEMLSKSLPVNDAQLGRDARYGNEMLYFSAPADADGQIRFSISYLVTRYAAGEEPLDDPGTQIEEYALRADTLVPVGGKSLSWLKDVTLPANQMALARVLYDVVDDHMQYRKDKPGWGRGDSNWACESGFGNCTDFHSVFISLARANHLPAKFQIGFSIPAAHGIDGGSGAVAGYHCWAWFKPDGHGWVPVDISEANKHPEKRDYFFGNLDANRVAFTTGRDLVLDPKQSGPPLNYFIFPYVEVNGEPYAPGKTVTTCSYEDIDQKQASATTKP